MRISVGKLQVLSHPTAIESVVGTEPAADEFSDPRVVRVLAHHAGKRVDQRLIVLKPAIDAAVVLGLRQPRHPSLVTNHGIVATRGRRVGIANRWTANK